jgi:hypothetical protein
LRPTSRSPWRRAKPPAQNRFDSQRFDPSSWGVSDAQQADADMVRDFSALIEAAKDLTAWVDRTLESLKPVTVRRLVLDPFAVIGRSVVLRQATAIKAAITRFAISWSMPSRGVSPCRHSGPVHRAQT